MMKESIEVKYQACNICDALHRNINDNFESVSFEIIKNGDIQVKIILRQRKEMEDEYIDDMIVELAAMQESDCVRVPIVEVGTDKVPLKHLVYMRGI